MSCTRVARTRRVSAVLVVAGLAAAGIAGCSSSSSNGASTSSGATSTTSGGSGLTNITVQTRADDGSGGLWIAEKDGFFKQQGLNVTIQYAQSTSSGFDELEAHTATVIEGNYINMLQAVSKDPAAGFRVIADNVRPGPNTNDLMVAGNSKITSVAQLKGKPVAFPGAGLDSAGVALDQDLLNDGIPANSYTQVAIPYASMAGALKTGEVAAAFAVQPYITEMETKDGDRRLVDLMSGSMLTFPLEGWMTTTYYLQNDAKTIAAFQRAIEEGQNAAAANPTLVRQLLVQNIKNLTQQTANAMNLRKYSNDITTAQLGQLVVAMQQAAALPKSFSYADLIVPLPSSSS